MPSTFWKALKGILQTPAENPSTGCLHRCSRPLLSASWAPMTAPLAGTGSGGRLYTLSERSDTHVHALTFRKGPSAATPASHGGWRLAELFVSELFTRQGATGRDSDFFATETPRKRPGPRVFDPDHLLQQPAWSLQKSDHAGSTEPADVRHKQRPVEELFSSVS